MQLTIIKFYIMIILVHNQMLMRKKSTSPSSTSLDASAHSIVLT